MYAAKLQHDLHRDLSSNPQVNPQVPCLHPSYHALSYRASPKYYACTLGTATPSSTMLHASFHALSYRPPSQVPCLRRATILHTQALQRLLMKLACLNSDRVVLEYQLILLF